MQNIEIEVGDERRVAMSAKSREAKKLHIIKYQLQERLECSLAQNRIGQVDHIS